MTAIGTHIALTVSPSEKQQLQARADQRHLKLATMIRADVLKMYKLKEETSETVSEG